MSINILHKKPLIEAIFEIRWEIESSDLSSVVSKQITLGQLLEKIRDDYSIYEPLAAPFFSPPGISVEGIPLHRFRINEGEWPLVQVGTGIVTINDTDNYTWEQFYPRIKRVVSQIIELHSLQEPLRLTSLSLKYIDAIEIDDSSSRNLLDFLKEKMKIEININDNLFNNNKIFTNPIDLNISASYQTKSSGTFAFRIFQGQKINRPSNSMSSALILENTVFKSDFVNSDSSLKQSIDQWLLDAHDILHNWFFTLIDGDLLESFK
jgi:uncharacterized protein (TIGR04255 family)